MTDGHAGTTAGQPQGLTRLYLIAWLVLVAITAIEISLILVFRVPPAVRATALIILAIMKATLIGAYYMGLRFERLAVVYVAVIPLLLLILMLIAVVPDVALLLVNAPHTFSLSVGMTVVRSHRVARGDYFLAGQFTRPLRHDGRWSPSVPN